MADRRGAGRGMADAGPLTAAHQCRRCGRHSVLRGWCVEHGATDTRPAYPTTTPLGHRIDAGCHCPRCAAPPPGPTPWPPWSVHGLLDRWRWVIAGTTVLWAVALLCGAPALLSYAAAAVTSAAALAVCEAVWVRRQARPAADVDPWAEAARWEAEGCPATAAVWRMLGALGPTNPPATEAAPEPDGEQA